MIMSRDNLELALLGLPANELALIKAAIAEEFDYSQPLSVDVKSYQKAIKEIAPQEGWPEMLAAAAKLSSRRLRYTQKNYHITTSFLSRWQTIPSAHEVLSLKLSGDISDALSAYPKGDLDDFLAACTSMPVAMLTRAYSSKLYLLLAERCVNGTALISYDDLRAAFALDDDSYSLVQNFKRRILVPAITDIHDIANIKVTYTDTTDSRKIIGFDFLVESVHTGESL